jgi:hypothetical protein
LHFHDQNFEVRDLEVGFLAEEEHLHLDARLGKGKQPHQRPHLERYRHDPRKLLGT